MIMHITLRIGNRNLDWPVSYLYDRKIWNRFLYWGRLLPDSMMKDTCMQIESFLISNGNKLVEHPQGPVSVTASFGIPQWPATIWWRFHMNECCSNNQIRWVKSVWWHFFHLGTIINQLLDNSSNLWIVNRMCIRNTLLGSTLEYGTER